MAAKNEKHKHYEKRSAILAIKAEEFRKIQKEKAEDILAKNLVAATQRLVDIANTTTIFDKDDVPSTRLVFDAVKHILKLGGLEIDRLAGADGQSPVIQITSDHAAKIREAAEK